MASTGLERFRAAQADARHGYLAALAELRTTGKRSHWIWYIFPQLAGLGQSPEARRYGLAAAAEARAYLEDFELRARLLECTTAVAERLEQGWSLLQIMGSPIDALKLVSSLTLFERVSDQLLRTNSEAEYLAVREAAERVLTAASSQGYPRCSFTTRAVAGI